MRSLWLHRDVLWYLTVRSLRAQHKQSVLGYVWLLLNPLTQLATLTFVFSVVFPNPSQDHPFVLFLAIGLFPWIFFANAVNQATDSIVASAGLVTAVYFPRDLVVISAVMIRMLDFLAGLLIIGVALVLFGQALTWNALWILPLFALQFLFILGISLPLAAFNLFFHDVRFLVGVVLHLWFFMTPIFYPVEFVPDQYRVIYDLNPMARFVGAYREAVLLHGSPPATSVALALGSTLLCLVIGYYLFRKLEPRFADRV